MDSPPQHPIDAPIPDSGRIVGIDFGTVRIGTAICDPDQKFSSPLEVYHRRSLSKDAAFFSDLAAQERIVGWVVGLPLHTSGSESQKSAQAREFGKWLLQTTGLPVRLIDERFTTSMAREILSQSKMSGKKRKERLDKIAAHILLSTYLETPSRSVSLAEIKEDALDDQPTNDT